jgi:L-ascorbate metabolism protein UlaG (beta-lactamase superfamily)
METEGFLNWRWRGLSCLELEAGGHTILIDPCFSRFPPWRMLWGPLTPTHGLAAQVRSCDSILITHAHWDHLLDAPQLALAASAAVYGSAGTAELMSGMGVPRGLVHQVSAGDSLSAEGFRLEVLPAEHEPVPGFGVGEPARGLRPPLRARDYRMDAYFSYLVTIGGQSVLTDPGVNPSAARRAEILFVQPQRGRTYYRDLLQRVQPRLVVPIHWDSLFRAMPRPCRRYLRPRFGRPPLARVDLHAFSLWVGYVLPTTRVIIPEINVWYGANPNDEAG